MLCVHNAYIRCRLDKYYKLKTMSEQEMLKKYRKLVWKLGFFKIRLLFFVRPQLEKLTDETVVLRVKLNKRTKNHLNSMYFGALAVGADLAAGVHSMYYCDKLGVQPHFSFKSMEGNFLKRVETDAIFICNSGEAIHTVVKQAHETKERQNFPVPVSVQNTNGEEVARFVMEMSIKLK